MAIQIYDVFVNNPNQFSRNVLWLCSFELEEIIMKQGRTLLELDREL